MAKSIPKDIKSKVLEIVETFNKEHNTSFEMTFRGKFAYLAKTEEQPMANIFRQMIAQKMGISTGKIPKQKGATIQTKLGRLKYNGQMDNWDFAVFKYSREFYDSEDWMFPGSSELDGTIEGALRAGLELYN
ncbi:MAG: hypothetical protein AAF597_01645 [Bacteroidota bacterium]